LRRLIAISVLILLAACSSPPSESATATATAAPTTAAEFEPESVLARLRSEFRVTEVKEDLEEKAPWFDRTWDLKADGNEVHIVTTHDYDSIVSWADTLKSFGGVGIHSTAEPWGIQVGNTDTGYRAKRAAYQAFAEELAQRLPSVQVIA
jgi:hypothetical protein